MSGLCTVDLEVRLAEQGRRMEVPQKAQLTVENVRMTSADDPSPDMRVLLIGRDSSLLSYRAAVLRQAGYRVQTAAPAEAKSLLRNDSFSAVVLGHTLAIEQVTEITALIRQRNPRPKILMILGPDPMPPEAPQFDGTTVGLDGPLAMIESVRKLTAT